MKSAHAGTTFGIFQSWIFDRYCYFFVALRYFAGIGSLKPIAFPAVGTGVLHYKCSYYRGTYAMLCYDCVPRRWVPCMLLRVPSPPPPLSFSLSPFFLLFLHSPPPHPPSPSLSLSSALVQVFPPAEERSLVSTWAGPFRGFNALTCLIPADVQITNQKLPYVSFPFVNAAVKAAWAVEQKTFNCAENHPPSFLSRLCCAMPCNAMPCCAMLVCYTISSYLLGNLCCAVIGHPLVPSCSKVCYATS